MVRTPIAHATIKVCELSGLRRVAVKVAKRTVRHASNSTYMTKARHQSNLGRDTLLSIYGGLAGAILLFLTIGFISYHNVNTLSRDATLVTHTHEVLTALEDVLSLTKDAETGQRGFVITGDERYLEPYNVALPRINERIADIERLTSDNADQQARIPALKSRIAVKFEELKETIALRRTDGFEAAQAVVIADNGKIAMDAIRDQTQEMEAAEQSLRQERLKEMTRAYQVAIVTGIIMALSGVLISFLVAFLLRRAALVRLRQEWIQRAQVSLSQLMSGDQQMKELGTNVLRFLAEYLNAPVGALYVNEGSFYLASTYGVPENGAPARFDAGDGLLGQAAQDRRSFILRDVPNGYLTLGSALGESAPRNLAIFPVQDEEGVKGIVELGFVNPVDNAVTELFDQASKSIALAIRAVTYRDHLQNLLEETQRQSEELQAQGEELRVSNEELEEQSRTLRESQTRLEQQQTELEQINAQLEEQAQLLESQRDEVSRAKEELERQARDLEQASQYKSDFLANMSHELRTPLNSSLILAKLLADNSHGNLNDEQIQYAQTIQGAGNDLLNLINDILDLSKIEAGHMVVQAESLRLAQIAESVSRMFKPIADQRSVEFRIELQPGVPESIYTDPQRLEQVLKNLLSNALKFTEKGRVELVLRADDNDTVSFAVSDTGIGIADHQQSMIFEAFRQADGTTNRRYGGTGLGLSISRELARLLGGSIHLASEPGRGSTFTVTIPRTYASVADIRPATAEAPDNSRVNRHSLSADAHRQTLDRRPEGSTNIWPRRVEDDRERLNGNQRVILVVEDDDSFSKILRDLAHELSFQCLIATHAEEAVAMAVQYSPSAVLLDVGLPDHSGLSVLDRLKQDRRTRHIPVHVVSAGDHAKTALSLGAVGYMLKPVNREQLVAALQQLESRFTQRMRRVLLVEDDPVQLDSMRKLLGSHDVQTVGVGNAAECLSLLSKTTFDCMVLDLSLPDSSGYSLLETLSREDAYAFPPVIIYTGRELSADEEHRLRRFSKSIIIKGAKSPERLLDEVTLFLHQVVAELPPEQQKMLEKARSRDAAFEGRRILVVEDDVRNVFALTSILEPRGAIVQIARNGYEALSALEGSRDDAAKAIDLVLMDVMMPEMDGLTAIMEIRKMPEWKKLSVIMLTAKAMKDDQERCLAAGANDYLAKPIDVERLLSLVRVWMPR